MVNIMTSFTTQFTYENKFFTNEWRSRAVIWNVSKILHCLKELKI